MPSTMVRHKTIIDERGAENIPCHDIVRPHECLARICLDIFDIDIAPKHGHHIYPYKWLCKLQKGLTRSEPVRRWGHFANR